MKNEKWTESEISTFKAEYSNTLTDIKNCVGSIVGTASEMFPHLETLREPASKTVVNTCMAHIANATASYLRLIKEAKNLSTILNDFI